MMVMVMMMMMMMRRRRRRRMVNSSQLSLLLGAILGTNLPLLLIVPVIYTFCVSMQSSQVLPEEVVLDIGGAMARCFILEIKTLLAHPGLASKARSVNTVGICHTCFTYIYVRRRIQHHDLCHSTLTHTHTTSNDTSRFNVALHLSNPC